jgi:hypothetical protein
VPFKKGKDLKVNKSFFCEINKGGSLARVETVGI